LPPLAIRSRSSSKYFSCPGGAVIRSMRPGTGAHYHTKIEEIFCTRSVMLPSSGKGAISVSRRRGSLLS
jgi:hypothetical protein